MVYDEINYALRHLKGWMDSEPASTSIAHFPTRTRVHSVPKGQVLLLTPWNYPFMLVFDPLQALIAAGNTAIIKLPWQVPAIAKVMDQLITETFDPAYVSCIAIEDEEVIPTLITGLRFDHIFFTGSTRVGKLIMAAASEQLIPVTLELGGKSPAIVDRSANLKVAARRIVWGKLFNVGQTCVAPDHVLVHQDVSNELLSLLHAEKECFIKAYGGLKGISKIVNRKRYDTLVSLIEDFDVEQERDEETLRMGLAIVEEPPMSAQMMQEEIFGPILPVITYADEKDLLEKLEQNPFPLAFYLFASDKQLEKRLMLEIPFGGGCINNCLVHFASPEAPRGGIGYSGMGSYHGKVGFDTFSHKKAIMKTGTWIDLPIRYAPYKSWKTWLVRLIFR
jgi:aldehyde dehydrogenase (NAD+)